MEKNKVRYIGTVMGEKKVYPQPSYLKAVSFPFPDSGTLVIFGGRWEGLLGRKRLGWQTGMRSRRL